MRLLGRLPGLAKLQPYPACTDLFLHVIGAYVSSFHCACGGGVVASLSDLSDQERRVGGERGSELRWARAVSVHVGQYAHLDCVSREGFIINKYLTRKLHPPWQEGNVFTVLASVPKGHQRSLSKFCELIDRQTGHVHQPSCVHEMFMEHLMDPYQPIVHKRSISKPSKCPPLLLCLLLTSTLRNTTGSAMSSTAKPISVQLLASGVLRAVLCSARCLLPSKI